MIMGDRSERVHQSKKLNEDDCGSDMHIVFDDRIKKMNEKLASLQLKFAE